MTIIRRDINGVVLFFDLERKEIHVSDSTKTIYMDEVRGEKDITKTAAPKGENVWTKILSRAESSPSDNSNNMDTIAKELSSAMAAEVLMVFPAKANAMLTDEEIRERTDGKGSVESSLNMLAKYGLLKRGIEVNNKGHCWHMTNLGVEMWEKLRSTHH
ncbi:MAG: hypothetical protein QMD78_04285 [Methanocellales archaeon]|nr:hypothetical protein [Methanocellales archaeon]